MFTLYNQIKQNKSGGQIAVFLVLILAVIFIFMVVTLNIGQVSQQNTLLSNAADGAALLLASSLASWGKVQWEPIWAYTEDKCKDEKGKETKCTWTLTQSEVSNWNFCKVSPRKVMALSGIAASIILAPWLGPVWGAIGIGIAGLNLGLQMTVFEPKLVQATQTLTERLFKALDTKTQIVESTIQYALNAIVDDPNLVPDIHDIDGDGDTKDLIPAFEAWKLERLHDLAGKQGAILRLRDKVKNLFNVTDPFRKFCAGEQEYPELLENPDWIPELRKKGYLIPENNIYYPLDGEFMKLLADLAAIKLPREAAKTKKEKEPITITNVEIPENLTVTIDFNPAVLVEYQEIFQHKAKFWNHDEAKEKDLASVLERLADENCKVDVLTFDPETNKCLDQVDYLVHALTMFRFLAYGSFTPEPVYVPPIRKKLPSPDDERWEGYWEGPAFSDGIIKLSELQLTESYARWVRQLINIDYDTQVGYVDGFPPELKDDPAYKKTFAAQLELLLKMTGDFKLGQGVPKYKDKGWIAELEKIRCKVEWQAKSGTYSPQQKKDNQPGFVGKMEELEKKMNRVCEIFNEFVEAWNKQACENDPWDFSCSSCDSQKTGYRCCGCGRGMLSWFVTHNAVCIQGLQKAIDERMAYVDNRIKQLEGELKKRARQLCENDCDSTYEDCIDACDEDEPGCEDDCADERTKCKEDCANADPAKYKDDPVIKQLYEAIDCRNRELAALETLWLIAEKLRLLAVSFDLVSDIESEIDVAQQQVERFWLAGANFYNYITDPLILKELDLLEKYKGYVNFTFEVLYPWKTKDEVTGKDVWHYAMVRLPDFKLPAVGDGDCGLVDVGSKVVNARGNIYVWVGRFDEDKMLSLGAKPTWLSWIFRRTKPGLPGGIDIRAIQKKMQELAEKGQEDTPEYKDLEKQYQKAISNSLYAIRYYGFKAFAEAHYSPCLGCTGVKHTDKPEDRGGVFLFHTN